MQRTLILLVILHHTLGARLPETQQVARLRGQAWALKAFIREHVPMVLQARWDPRRGMDQMAKVLQKAVDRRKLSLVCGLLEVVSARTLLRPAMQAHPVPRLGMALEGVLAAECSLH